MNHHSSFLPKNDFPTITSRFSAGSMNKDRVTRKGSFQCGEKTFAKKTSPWSQYPWQSLPTASFLGCRRSQKHQRVNTLSKTLRNPLHAYVYWFFVLSGRREIRLLRVYIYIHIYIDTYIYHVRVCGIYCYYILHDQKSFCGHLLIEKHPNDGSRGKNPSHWGWFSHPSSKINKRNFD